MNKISDGQIYQENHENPESRIDSKESLAEQRSKKVYLKEMHYHRYYSYLQWCHLTTYTGGHKN